MERPASQVLAQNLGTPKKGGKIGRMTSSMTWIFSKKRGVDAQILWRMEDQNSSFRRHPCANLWHQATKSMESS